MSFSNKEYNRMAISRNDVYSCEIRLVDKENNDVKIRHDDIIVILYDTDREKKIEVEHKIEDNKLKISFKAKLDIATYTLTVLTKKRERIIKKVIRVS